MSIRLRLRVIAASGLLALALSTTSTAQCPPFFEPGAGFTGFRIGQGYAVMGNLSVRGCLWDPDGEGPRETALIVVAPDHSPYSYEHSLGDLYIWNGSAWEDAPTIVRINSYTRRARLFNYRGDLVLATADATSPGAGSFRYAARYDGSTWTQLGDTTGWSQWWNMYSAGGDLYATGSPLRCAGGTYSNIARFDGAQWVAFADGMWTSHYSVPEAVQAWQGRIYVAGTRTAMDPNASAKITATDGAGTITVPGLNGNVQHLADWNDSLIAAGDFTTAGGLPVNGLASWDGASWHGLGFPLADAAIMAIGVVGEQLIVLAAPHPGSSEFAEIWTLDTEGWACESSYVRAPVGFGYDILGPNGDPTILGTLFHVDGSFVAGLITRQDGVWRAPGNGTDRPIRDIAATDIGDFVVGYFRQIEGVLANCVAMRSGETWQSLPSLTDVNGYLTTATPHDGALVVGGNYVSPRGASFSHIALWTGDEWQALGDGAPLTDIRALASDGSTLYAAGKGGIASFASNTWSPIGTPIVSTLSIPITELAMHDGVLVAAGRFTRIASVAANSIARWNGATWSSMGTGLDGTVYSLCEHEGDLIAAGSFAIPGHTERNLAWWNGEAWEPFQGGTDGPVVTVRSMGRSLFIHGQFSRVGDSIISDTALFNGHAWRPLLMDIPSANALIHDVELVAGRWLAVGDFSALNNLPQSYLSRFSLPCDADYLCDGVVDALDLISFLDDFVLCQRPPDGQPVNGVVAPPSGGTSAGPLGGDLNQTSAWYDSFVSCGDHGNPDLNADGVTDVIDLLDYFDAFAMPCE